MSAVTIYHNPMCGTSRNTLALIAAMDIPVRDVLRQKGTPYEELGLGNPKWADDELIDSMIA